MAARTQVVVTTVGPYTKYGLPLVAACAAAGTDYADLTGEPPFVRESIDLYHKQAQDTGARIVHACGFDSIPSDLTVYALYRRAHEDGAGELGDTDFVLRRSPAGSPAAPSPRWWKYRRRSRDPEVRRQWDPYTLTPDRGADPNSVPSPTCGAARPRDRAGTHRAVDPGFVMAWRTPESCGAPMHFWIGPTAAGSGTRRT